MAYINDIRNHGLGIHVFIDSYKKASLAFKISKNKSNINPHPNHQLKNPKFFIQIFYIPEWTNL